MATENGRGNESRRRFMKRAALATGAALTPMPLQLRRPVAASMPVVVASANGGAAVRKALEMIQSGSDALDAVVEGVSIVEADPEDTSVGYGGLPNFDGVVELDAAVMHGASARAGAVAALQGIKQPSRVARRVLERTDHVLLVGSGAQQFARMQGFRVEELLTERARKEWVKWREELSEEDDYVTPERDGGIGGRAGRQADRHHGTIHLSAIDLAGNLSCATTTSGLSYKIPGRVGDSPIIGAGLYVDNVIGAAGSTGRGEANLENLCCFLIVERMRAGDSPTDACLHACKRIVSNTKIARLRRTDGLPNFNVKFYALRRDGTFGGAEIHPTGGSMVVATPEGVEQRRLAHL